MSAFVVREVQDGRQGEPTIILYGIVLIIVLMLMTYTG